ncbi:MAG TPA: DUF2868 domain-containing protein [Casimicrobiaceae bacterium]|nr:DUF2868 domain-containing protein [Casimicrobiaceae bacterium]
MNERDALLVTAVRSVESADRARALWSDADRAWASRAAAEVVGENAQSDVFLARRAALAFERLRDRYAPLRNVVDAVRWRSWIGLAIVVIAFVIGVAVDRIGTSQRINLLAPPVLAILAWNVAVYVVLAWQAMLSATGAGRVSTGPWRRALVMLAARLHRLPRHDAASPLGAAIATFASNWASCAAPLYYARAARILHVAAALLALGILTGLYLRGLAFEYRATWESTFLDAATVQRLLSWLLWPGSIVTGIPIPTVQELEAIRTSDAPASTNAASWLHLIAATVAVVVIIPRFVLAAFAFALERYRATRMPVSPDAPYFQRVLRGFRGGPMRVTVYPYSYRVAAPSLAGLQSLVSRIFGGSASLVVHSPITYGDEDEMRAPDKNAVGPTLALFSLAATPEREAHGALLANLQAVAAGHAVIALIDEAPFREKSGEDTRRLDERRASWREILSERSPEPIFVDLRKPDLAALETEFESRLDAPEKP